MYQIRRKTSRPLGVTMATFTSVKEAGEHLAYLKKNRSPAEYYVVKLTEVELIPTTTYEVKEV